MDDREFLSEGEYLAGRDKDGRKPVHHSRLLTPDPTKPFSDEPAEPPVADEKRSPQQIEKDRLHYNIELVRLDQLDYAARYSRKMMELGFAAMDGGAPAGTVPEVRDCPRSSNESDASTDAGAGEQSESCPIRDTGTVPNGGDSPLSGTPRSGPRGIPAEPYAFTYNEIARGPRKVASVSSILLPPVAHDGVDEKLAAIIEETDKFVAIDLRNQDAGGLAPFSPEPACESDGSGDAKTVPDPLCADVTKRGQAPFTPEHPAAGRKSNRAQMAPDPSDSPLTPAQCIAIGERGAKLLVVISEERAKVAHKLVDMAGKLDVRDSFLQDRAHALVYGTLLHLDATFSDLGFGAWMPFRFPDQWLSFCGVLSRVLAANGLIHSKYADVYRRLLDETPPVELEGTPDERIRESRTPHNIAQCKSNQGAYTLSELKTRLHSEVWDPADRFNELWDQHWETQLIKPSIKPPP
jgi:hypothetical protein